MGFINGIKDIAKEALIYGVMFFPIWAPLAYIGGDWVYERHKTRVRFAEFYSNKHYTGVETGYEGKLKDGSKVVFKKGPLSDPMGEFPYVNTIIRAYPSERIESFHEFQNYKNTRESPTGNVEAFHDFDNDGKFDLWGSYSSLKDFQYDVNRGLAQSLMGVGSQKTGMLRIDGTDNFLYGKTDGSSTTNLDTLDMNDPLVVEGQRIFKETLDECLRHGK